MTAHPPEPEIDFYNPSPARVHDYLIGGKDNFEVDRAAVRELTDTIPSLPAMALATRAWLGRVVTHLAGEAGVTQFLDIGSGLPTTGNTHTIAQTAAPAARVVYVDNDHLVLAHCRALLTENPRVRVVHGDLRDPHRILDHPEVTGLIDPTRPIALILSSVLAFLGDHDRPHDAVAALRARLAPGSYLAVSHPDNTVAPDQAAHLDQLYATLSPPGKTRSPEEIARFLTGLRLLDPGLVHVGHWRPAPGEPTWTPEQAWVLAGVGRLDHPATPPP
ncbi:SAM-dependent methyltransferase [Actinorugispora endophytica]|uniref:S-adenosyl methyltransferase n=1 Tax=Actinorugispora endophytica TaxID=1605990 RepID=A0A4R6V793_9ACTN|nr:SAM-dependent methyltransferase [Actinorugispora endophytica]TDQ54397.1 S-adenosyl methyltransferase [Actinorugispora endophytica]